MLADLQRYPRFGMGCGHTDQRADQALERPHLRRRRSAAVAWSAREHAAPGCARADRAPEPAMRDALRAWLEYDPGRFGDTRRFSTADRDAESIARWRVIVNVKRLPPTIAPDTARPSAPSPGAMPPTTAR